jgi:hypothetical protein
MASRSLLILMLPLALIAGLMIPETIADGMPDLFIYRAGARLGWQQQSPYGPGIAVAVAEQWPERTELRDNCGFFLPPMAIVIFGPFAAVDWITAKWLYFFASLVGLFVITSLASHVFRVESVMGWPSLTRTPWPVVWIIALHLLTTMTIVAGQTSLLAAAAILLGQWCHERGRVIMGALFWSMAFMKPHVALPLIPLAYAISGWRRMSWLIVWLVIVNVAASILVTGSLRLLFDYLSYVQSSHQTVAFNRIDWNPQITSWNRLLSSLKIATINLNLLSTLAGYGVIAIVISARMAISVSRPSSAWLAAVAAASAGVACQVMPYEHMMLVMAVPYVMECWPTRRRWAIAVALFPVLQMIPMSQAIWDLGLGAYRATFSLALLLILLTAKWNQGLVK